MVRRKHAAKRIAEDLEIEVTDLHKGRRKPRLFKRLNVQGNAWRVFLVDRDTEPDLAGNDGVTSVDDSLIALDDRLEPTRMGSAFVHELLHACLSAPASKEVLAKLFGCKPEEVVDKEESMVSYLAPILFDTLARNGLLKLPRVPA